MQQALAAQGTMGVGASRRQRQMPLQGFTDGANANLDETNGRNVCGSLCRADARQL